MRTISLRRIVVLFALLFLMIIGLRFLYRATHYFTFTEASYSPYFWPRANWVFSHLLFGMTALLIGPFQFIATIRKKYVNVHRTIGKIYLLCILFGATAGIYLSMTSKVTEAYKFGLFFLAIAWLTTSLMAYISIKKGNSKIHREWMVRSYVVTFAFVTFRLCDEILAKTTSIPDPDRLTLVSWACWAVPLFFTQVILEAKKLSSRKSLTNLN